MRRHGSGCPACLAAGKGGGDHAAADPVAPHAWPPEREEWGAPPCEERRAAPSLSPREGDGESGREGAAIARGEKGKRERPT